LVGKGDRSRALCRCIASLYTGWRWLLTLAERQQDSYAITARQARRWGVVSFQRRLLLEGLEQRLCMAGDMNDTLAEAISLGAITTTPKTVNAAITPDTDVNIYSFTVTTGQVVDFNINTPQNGPGGLGSYLRLFDSQGQQLAFNDDAAAPGENVVGFDAYLRFTFTNSGTFFIGVSNFTNNAYDPIAGEQDTSGGQFSTGAYQLIVQGLPIDANDTLAEAIPLGAVTTKAALFDATIFPDIDVNIYRFSVTAGQVVDFDIDTPLNGPGGLGSFLRLFDSTGQELALNNDAAAPDENVVGFDAFLRFTFVTGGTFFVGVSNFNNTQYDPITGSGDTAGGQFSIGSYQLRVQAVFNDPNDTLTEATPLGAITTTATLVNATITPDIDVNLYRFTVVAGQVVDFNINTTLNGPGGLDSFVRLFDAFGQQLAFNDSGTAPGENTSGFDAFLRFSFLAGGTFFLGVSNATNIHYDPVTGDGDIAGGQNSTGSYQLIVQALPIDANDSIAEAMSIGAITTNPTIVDAAITPDIDVNIYQLMVPASELVDFNLNTTLNGPGGLNSSLRLFDSLGQQLAFNDGAAAPGESQVGFDAYLRYNFTTAGTFYIGVSNATNVRYDPLTGNGDTAGGQNSIGSYQLIVQAVELSLPTLTVSISPAVISENTGSALGTVTRSDSSISQPLVVSLGSSDTSEAAVPATVTIPANQSSVTFAVTAVDDTVLDGTQTVTITAGAVGYVGGSQTIDVTDFEALSMTIIPAVISENGGTAAGTVTRNNTDYSAALTVTLSSSDTSAVRVPAAVTIPVGQASATFTVAGADDAILNGPRAATIFASAPGYVGGSQAIDVTDFETLTVTINPAAISENGGMATGTVTRSNTNISAPLIVALASSDTSEVTVPATVTIPPNSASTSFAISAVNDALLDGPQTATISATAASYVGGSHTITVTDAAVLTVTISPTAISENGGRATGTVTRSDIGAGAALTVGLTSSDLSEAAVPATMTIPAGQASGTFVVMGTDDTLLDGTQHVVITAIAAGYASASAGLDVTDDDHSLVLALSGDLLSANGGIILGTVSRMGSSISQPLVVNVASDNTAATVPGTVTIPSGQATADFTITGTANVQGVQRATITISAPGFPSTAKTVLVTDGARPYQNSRNPLDVDGDQLVVPRDALLIFNILNQIGPGAAATVMAQNQGAFFPDTNGDNFISAIDALLVINALNSQQGGQGEGEGEPPAFQLAASSALDSPVVASPHPRLVETRNQPMGPILDRLGGTLATAISPPSAHANAQDTVAFDELLADLSLDLATTISPPSAPAIAQETVGELFADLSLDLAAANSPPSAPAIAQETVDELFADLSLVLAAAISPPSAPAIAQETDDALFADFRLDLATATSPPSAPAIAQQTVAFDELFADFSPDLATATSPPSAHAIAQETVAFDELFADLRAQPGKINWADELDG